MVLVLIIMISIICMQFYLTGDQNQLQVFVDRIQNIPCIFVWCFFLFRQDLLNSYIVLFISSFFEIEYSQRIKIETETAT